MVTTREQFHSELEEIKEEIKKMAELSGEALSKAMDSFFKQDVELAKEVLVEDRAIDKIDDEINEKSVLLIAKQSPVATDLRRIIIGLQVVTDIERMGDNAKNIAKATLEVGDNKSSIPDGVQEMYGIVQEMLKTAMHAFKYEDITLAGSLVETDDKVDHLYRQVISELLGKTATHPEKIQFIMQVAFIARYLERFADHITNIGESVIYLVKGGSASLN